MSSRMKMISTSLVARLLQRRVGGNVPSVDVVHGKGIADGKPARLFEIFARRCDTLIPHFGAPTGHTVIRSTL
jgi:hypothetical protein